MVEDGSLYSLSYRDLAQQLFVKKPMTNDDSVWLLPGDNILIFNHTEWGDQMNDV